MYGDGMAVETEILFGGNNSRSRRLPGGGPLEKPIVFWETSGCKEFVTASAGFAGGAVSHPRTFIASILSGPGNPSWPAKVKFQNPGLAHPLMRASFQIVCAGDLVHEAVHPHVHHHAQSQKREQHRGTSIAHKRKGYPGDRHQPNDHSYIDRDLKNQYGHHAHNQERA